MIRLKLYPGKKITVSSKFLLTNDPSFIENTVIYNTVSPEICDPMLIDPEKRDFGLLAGSPCIGAGSITPFLIDWIFEERMEDRIPVDIPTVMDIGAIPYQSPSITLSERAIYENKRADPAIKGAVVHTGFLHPSRNKIMIFDIHGRLVKRTRVQADMAAIDLKELSLRAGSYIIRIVGGSSARSLRYLQR